MDVETANRLVLTFLKEAQRREPHRAAAIEQAAQHYTTGKQLQAHSDPTAHLVSGAAVLASYSPLTARDYYIEVMRRDRAAGGQVGSVLRSMGVTNLPSFVPPTWALPAGLVGGAVLLISLALFATRRRSHAVY